ncbi:tetratricopeptide repeat protein [Rhodopirellula sp. MGV]|uniref:tetratricopeptide repeat protein n=1 Tax=Rhodopirellula sp. MGV TaxID=2023130 RepID=UPI00396561FC
MYRAGDYEQASSRFGKVLASGNPVAATEAAHWLARIKLTGNDAASAIAIARKQLDQGAEGPFLFDLQVDLADALALNPETLAESIDVAEKAYRSDPSDPLAPRALYNAAFSALQSNQYEKAGQLANEFIQRFASDQLAADVRFISAESELMRGNVDGAIAKYQALLDQASADASQRPVWILRTAMALNRMQDYKSCIELLNREYETIKDDAQKAEAQFLLGQAHMLSEQPADAAASFERCATLVPGTSRATEAMLLRGSALLAAGEADAASQVWQSVIEADGASRMADQARYKLAQAAADAMRHEDAIRLYQAIIDGKHDPGLIPFALYGLGWSSMQVGQHQQSIAPLTRLIDEFPEHALADDALLARGISHRTLSDWASAKSDLQAYLKREPAPEGENLGHALYELAIVEQKSGEFASAAERLKRLIREVPEYPSMDDVLYELAWSSRQAELPADAVSSFRQLYERFPESKYAAEAAYFVAQDAYQKGDWAAAATSFRAAADKTNDASTSEKALYRLGWSYYKESAFEDAKNAFAEQAKKHPQGTMAIDALMMVGECSFKTQAYEEALTAYSSGRDLIRSSDDTAQSITDAAERQVRELILLHGGQSAAQLGRWDDAIAWYDDLKTRFPATAYLPQSYYETGVAYQQKGENAKALDYFKQVAERYRRREVGARARFMSGEIYFGDKQFDKAIPEFQAVMFGFGGEDAPAEIKNWQAKSGFEAGRCSELLMQNAKTDEARDRAKSFAIQFYKYVIDKHADHELIAKAKDRLAALGGG